MPPYLPTYNYLKFKGIFNPWSARFSCIMTNFCLSYKNFKGFYEDIELERDGCQGKQQAGLEGKYFYRQGR
jgi:hypothetical protein